MVSTLGFIPATPEEVAERLATKMAIIRQTLMLKGEYLSDPAIYGRVCWIPAGSGHKLVVKPEASPTPAGENRSSPVNNLSPPSAISADSGLPTPSVTPPPTPATPAILTMVVQVVPGQSWLYPDGKWTGPTQFIKHFSDVKLLCTGTAPDHMRFRHDFPTSVAALNSIMDEVRTVGNPATGVLSGPDQYIKARHSLFVVS